MRTIVVFLGAAASLMPLDALPAAAMTAAGSTAIRTAAEAVSPVERVACWRYGWRGFGVYPGWCVFRRAYVVPRPVYVAPVYRPPARCWIRGRWRVC